ncbi:Rpn family recombination-promoting nuclease/putative transposase [Limosilactobacillus sp.]|jgi:predicted transposase/invertase (TIGR01784 family)|uniref:Rpn family recombination-promoting nuclease/putative transposase n=1 Tax=Limosilactobacillus sp. TaxID=2773925 RepID=UPI0025BA6F84|nr:Rpn family recombination-promoting nuclease/putative transposase [Limosilactobacillus sp.]MCH3921963.1 Rpn family recombination-promoting nuclease/putative transposase [Limosilactobacillus sp.]MCH3928734.1 Rpn family recombination-promoting nuclease/putative transposase [Limosilactobacillus sp.]
MSLTTDKQLIAKRWEAASLTDDFVFSKALLDPQISLQIIKRVFPARRINNIQLLNPQQEMGATYDAKSVRFDIYAIDDHGSRYDLEMQQLDRHNLPYRNRYYQSTLANDCYLKGEDYNQADNANVVFFCCFDPFGIGAQRYDSPRSLVNFPTYPYRDGESTTYFDINSLQHTVGPGLQNLFDLMAGRSVDESDALIIQLRQRIQFVKQNRKWRADYMLKSLYEMDLEHDRAVAVKEGREQGIKQGIEQGIEQGQQSQQLIMVKNLIKNGQTQEQVITFLTQLQGMSPHAAKDLYQAAKHS